MDKGNNMENVASQKKNEVQKYHKIEVFIEKGFKFWKKRVNVINMYSKFH